MELISPRLVDEYKLRPLEHNGRVYTRIKRACNGLKQSGKIAYDDLVAHKAKYGYHCAPRTEARPLSQNGTSHLHYWWMTSE